MGEDLRLELSWEIINNLALRLSSSSWKTWGRSDGLCLNCCNFNLRTDKLRIWMTERLHLASHLADNIHDKPHLWPRDFFWWNLYVGIADPNSFLSSLVQLGSSLRIEKLWHPGKASKSRCSFLFKGAKSRYLGIRSDIPLGVVPLRISALV